MDDLGVYKSVICYFLVQRHPYPQDGGWPQDQLPHTRRPRQATYGLHTSGTTEEGRPRGPRGGGPALPETGHPLPGSLGVSQELVLVTADSQGDEALAGGTRRLEVRRLCPLD